MHTPILGIQLYSLRREFEADAEGTLRRVRGLGYDYIETAGTYGWPVERWQELLAETGLRVAGAHLNILNEDLEDQVKFQSALGNHRYVVPSLPVEQHTAAGFAQAAARMNEVGTALQRHQASLYYHNHFFEFKDFEGKTGFDILLAETDPALVSFEVDTYWVEKSGRAAGKFVERHALRIGMIHAKEFRRRDQSDQPAGEGDIDFPAIVSLSRENGWPLIVEYEGESAIEASRKSAAYLRSLFK